MNGIPVREHCRIVRADHHEADSDRCDCRTSRPLFGACFGAGRRPGTGFSASAGPGPALGVLVLAERQHHQGRRHGRPRSDEARRHRRCAHHGGGPGSPRGPGGFHGPAVARPLPARSRRGEAARPRGEHEQRRRLERQRRTLDPARAVYAGGRLDGNRRPRRTAFRRSTCPAASDGGFLSGHCGAGVPRGRRLPHPER